MFWFNIAFSVRENTEDWFIYAINGQKCSDQILFAIRLNIFKTRNIIEILFLPFSFSMFNSFWVEKQLAYVLFQVSLNIKEQSQ